MTTLLVAAAAVLYGLALPAVSPAAKPSKSDARLDRALEALTADPQGPPGAISVIERGDRKRVYRAGVAVLGGGPPKAGDWMRIASVAKAFSGAVALQLVERKRLRLDDSVRALLPWLPAAWEPATLRTALQHTSGLPDYTDDPAWAADLGADLKRHFTPEQLVGYVADDPLGFAPGSAYKYSNTDNILIALAAQAATGRSYESLLRRLVFRPLDLRHTSLPSGFSLPHPFLHGYAGGGPGEPLEDLSEEIDFSGAWASGGIASTPTDLNSFIRAYGGDDLLGGKLRRQQRRFVVGGTSDPIGPGRNSAGLALFRYGTRCGKVYGHTGSFPGYTQFAASTANGKRSATVSVSQQISDTMGPAPVFERLREAFELAVCAARPGKDRG